VTGCTAMAVAVNKIREHHGRRGPRDKACVAAHMRDQHKEGDAGAGTENDGSTNDVQEFDEIVDHGARAFGFMTAPPARRPLAKRAKDGGRGRTRTYEGVSQRIYSLTSTIDRTQEFCLVSQSCRFHRFSA
jgi:hypothetical protein